MFTYLDFIIYSNISSNFHSQMCLLINIFFFLRSWQFGKSDICNYFPWVEFSFIEDPGKRSGTAWTFIFDNFLITFPSFINNSTSKEHISWILNYVLVMTLIIFSQTFNTSIIADSTCLTTRLFILLTCYDSFLVNLYYIYYLIYV